MKFFKNFHQYNQKIMLATAALITLSFIALLTRNTHHDLAPAKTIPKVVSVQSSVPEAIIRYPIRLQIPSINTDSTLEYIGLSATGILSAPKQAANAGWFALGPKPGEKGSAVIDGHFGYENNIPAVFDNLHKLGVGDSVNVIDETGGNLQFIVREVKVFGEKDDASSIFGLGDGKSHLNLITCQGAWNEAQKSYSGRLVVFTDLAPKI